MMLYLNGQDIDHLVLGLVEKTGDVFSFVDQPVTAECRSEDFLANVVEYLKTKNIEKTELSGIIVVSGSGSATGLRVSHALANAWAFAGELDLYSLVKPKDTLDVDALSLVDAEAKTFVRPEYERAPTITTSKKDALRR